LPLSSPGWSPHSAASSSSAGSRAGGLRGQQTGETRFPAPVVFGHFLLAAAGLVVRIIYLVADKDGLAWTSFGILVAVALLGFTLFARWLPIHRARGRHSTARTAAAGPLGRRPPSSGGHDPGTRVG
jgi:hypothetical protein